jgi:uncharacterized protein YdhG (YjbR/CyaY superfamily)
MEVKNYLTIEEYILQQEIRVQPILQKIRTTIQKAAPLATEVISYQMPAFVQNGILVYFAAYKNHIGFYPTGIVIETFKEEIKHYKSSKGAVQFSLKEPIPYSLITDMVKWKVKNNFVKLESKKKIRKQRKNL